ncbi:MAG: VWA domain-containing protein [Caldilineaceae bacterium]
MTTSSFAFASPWLLLLLAAVPLGWWWMRRRNTGIPTLRYSDVRAVQTRHPSWRLRLRPLPGLLRMLTLALMVVGLARPQWVQAREIVRGEGVDIALALDISGSMASLDFAPDNRLEAAKRVIDEFVQARALDRIGLVVFAADAFNQSPPTSDQRVLRRLLAETQLAPDLGLQDGTAIGMGLANAAYMLQGSQAASRVVILLTDGVNNAGSIDPLTAAQAAAALGIKVYTIGMGKPGMVPVPVDDGFGGEEVAMMQSEIDEGMLAMIADATGGRYYRADDATALREVYAEIDALEKSQFETETFTNTLELMGWALVPGLMLLMVDLLMRSTFLRTLP